MAEALPTLIKLAERRVEDIQLEVTRTRAAIEATGNDIAAREEAIAKAFADVERDTQVLGLRAAGSFRVRMGEEIAQLGMVKAALEEQEAKLLEKLHAAFAEQKRFEILLEQKQAKAKKVLARKRQAQLDDLAQRRV